MLQNKTGIIFGVANKRSIAWATAQALHEAGARLAFTYQGDRLKENVEGLTNESMPGSLLLPCDVTKQEEVDATFKRVGEEFGRLDFVIHSIAYAPREALSGEFLATSREAFLTALEIALTRSRSRAPEASNALMTEGGSLLNELHLTTDEGRKKGVAGYKFMGVAQGRTRSQHACTWQLILARANIRSTPSVPVRFFKRSPLADFGDFSSMLKHAATKKAPLRATVNRAKWGNNALFLCSPLSSAITGGSSTSMGYTHHGNLKTSSAFPVQRLRVQGAFWKPLFETRNSKTRNSKLNHGRSKYQKPAAGTTQDEQLLDESGRMS